MSELEKTYDPTEVEPRLYAAWKSAGRFSPPSTGDRPTYTCVLPPPNVTGRLHMGHALTATIEDTMVRWHGMRGFDALWLPGTDHAGIATQMMVERELAKEGTDRHTLGREKFLERVWAWKEEHGGIIDAQHEALGASLDWSRYRFTMDEVSSRAVREAFVRLYEEGLIYRDYRLINWDWKSQTALSDLEVKHEDVQGKLWHIEYPVEGSDKTLTVATTRPETMLGDSGVAVHPDDPRYQDLIGKHVVLPLTGRRVPIVGDSILVDMEFGTGAVKVTPAHDFNDFETGKRHDLEVICIVGTDGRICAPAPEAFVGLTVDEARKAVLDALEKEGRLGAIEEHAMAVGYSDRTKVVVEPLPSTQWFVNVGPMAEKALAAVRNGDTQIIPAHRTDDYYRWMENIHDWCISRQLWWGHRIPAWHCSTCAHITVSRDDPSECGGCGGKDIRQDDDVLDTWFSSGLWPLTTLGWPDETDDLKRFYPTALMETGWDILFFWVARMMMLGTHLRGEVPFKKVFLHSMVLGENGKKMSKTAGNVVDPNGLVAEYGADALRFYLATMAGQDLGIVFSEARVEGYKKFCTKLWNAARFAQMNFEGLDLEAWRAKVIDQGDVSELGVGDRWILGRCHEVATQVAEHLDAFRLDLAAHALYSFTWHELCDWYLELAKPRLREEGPGRAATQGALATVLDVTLRLLHPLIPFVTEEIWTRMPKPAGAGESLMEADYPRIEEGPRFGPLFAGVELEKSEGVREALADVGYLQNMVSAVRSMKADCKVSPAQKVDVIVKTYGEHAGSVQRVAEAAKNLGRFGSLKLVAESDELPRESAVQVFDGYEVCLPLAGLVDMDAERARLRKEVTKDEKTVTSLQKKLGNAGFVSKAPPDVVEAEKLRLVAAEGALEKKRALLERLGG